MTEHREPTFKLAIELLETFRDDETHDLKERHEAAKWAVTFHRIQCEHVEWLAKKCGTIL